MQSLVLNQLNRCHLVGFKTISVSNEKLYICLKLLKEPYPVATYMYHVTRLMNSSDDPDQLASSITVLRSVIDLSLSGRVLDLRLWGCGGRPIPTRQKNCLLGCKESKQTSINQ